MIEDLFDFIEDVTGWQFDESVQALIVSAGLAVLVFGMVALLVWRLSRFEQEREYLERHDAQAQLRRLRDKD